MKKLFTFIITLALFTPIMAIAGSARGEIKPAPWSGDWWSRKKGFLVNGWRGHQPSAFARYDQYVESRTGSNPGARAWEMNPKNTHYNPNAENWEGHCNGWSASSILFPEPTKRHIRNNIVFDTSDQKGILAEICMNVYCNFYGNRYWGNANDDINDIYPNEFHRLLMENIATGKTAMICDTECGKQVWNFPIYKFESTWKKSWFDDSKLKVKTTVYFVDDGVRPDFVGTKWFSTTYTYNLFLDNKGNVVDGEWTGASKRNHPDFIWIPTADAPAPKNSIQENPCFDTKFVNEIITGPENQNLNDSNNIRSPDEVVMEAGLDPAQLF